MALFELAAILVSEPFTVETTAYPVVQVSLLLLVACIMVVLVAGILIYFYNQRLVKEKDEMINLLQVNNAILLKAKEELKEAKEKMEQSDKLKSTFLANMSHELRTPLNAIIGFSSLLLESMVSKDESREYLEIIQNNSNKLLDLMDEVFNISLIESGITSMYKENCPLNELLMTLVTFFNMEKETMEGKDNVSLKVKRSNKDNTFSLYTDPRKLRQTLYNLIENALKYTNDGYVEMGYELKEDSMVQFYVKDTGIGFPQEKLNILFQQFRQFDDSNSRQYGGIGLGLWLSQKFVEMMGGRMWGESTPGEGSVFYFTIPYEVNQEATNK